MASTLINNNDQITIHPNQPILFDAQLFSVPGVESETDLDGTTTVIENLEKQSPIKPTETSTPVRVSSGLSISASSTRSKKSKSRSYKFIQLERALTTANLLKNNEDRIKFENEYLNSIHENKFDEFLQNYYQKLHDHNEHIKQKCELKQARIFTFFDLEKNFLALDPTRDVKIIFLDESKPSTIKKQTNTHRSSTSAHQRSISAVNDTAIESFYAKRSHHLLANQSRARNEITLFARRTAERLHEHLPRLSSVPHRVKVIDERDITGKSNENILLQLKHKHKLSLINKRRHIIHKMIGQTKKNQIKMEEQWNKTSLTIDNSTYCRELLEQANQIEQIYTEEQIRQRPQTEIIERRIRNKNISSIASSNITTNTNIIPSLSSYSTTYQDALSIHHVEKIKNVRVIQSTRPITAPMKVNWINYC